MLQGCRLLKWCRNLPAGHCVAGVQTAKVVLEPTCLALCCRCAGCSSSVRTYLPGTVGQGSICFSSVGTYLTGTVLQGCRLFNWCWNLPPMHCGTGVQAVDAVLKPTCRSLCCRGTGCISVVGTSLTGRVLQGHKLLNRC